jgi:hypothetical protein
MRGVKEMKSLKSIIFVGMLMVTVVAFAATEDENNMTALELLFQQKKYEEISQLVEEKFTNLERERDTYDIDDLVSIGKTAIIAGEKDNDEYGIFFYIAEKLIAYSSDNPELRIAVYDVQSRLISRFLGEVQEMEDVPEQIGQRAKIMLGNFLKNIEERIIPDYQPRPAYLNVPPPMSIVMSSDEPIGLNPYAVTNPVIRQQWLDAIKENEKNAYMNQEQRLLTEMESEFKPRIISFCERQ